MKFLYNGLLVNILQSKILYTDLENDCMNYIAVLIVIPVKTGLLGLVYQGWSL